MSKIGVSIVILLFALACTTKTDKMDVSDIKTKVVVDRFDKKFYHANKSSLQELKSQYPYLFPVANDSIWLKKMNDSTEMALFKKADSVFSDFDETKNQISNLYKHVKYYFPAFKEPKMITLITDLDYKNRVIYADSLLLVSLDLYLGKNSNVYNDFPKYISQNFEKSQLVVDIAKSFADNIFAPQRNRQFLYSMINEGKKMYLIDVFLPEVSDAHKMGYTIDKMDWVQLNETPIWKYFIENELLYSTDTDLYERFIAEAPFSKFYIDIDKESPGKIGVWLGWQIVRSYMQNNNVTLQQLLQTDAQEVFKKSKYKPKK